MAAFQLVNKQTVEKWSNTYAAEYIRESALLPYMGTGETNIIRVRTELQNSAGALVHFPLVARLRGAGVSGGTALYGSEDTLPTYSDSVRTKLIRNGVQFPESETYKTELDVFNAGRATLKNWSAEKLRDDIITELGAVIVAGGTETDGTVAEDSSKAYSAASATERNNHLVANTDRTLFGSLKSNNTGVMSTSLANINNTTGKLTAAVISTAKTLAKKAGSATGKSHIAPFKSDMTMGQEYFVLFVGSEGFRDLSNDPVIINANTYARSRESNGMDKNPLFQDGDMIYRGIIIREMPENPTVTGAGAGGIDVAQAYLCGQSAIAVAYSKKPEPKTQVFDYEHTYGVAIREIRGQKKVSFGGVQYGVVTLWHAAVADA